MLHDPDAARHYHRPHIVLPDDPGTTVTTVTVVELVEVTVVETQQVFDPNSTAHFQTKMTRAPVWFVSIGPATIARNTAFAKSWRISRGRGRC